MPKKSINKTRSQNECENSDNGGETGGTDTDGKSCVCVCSSARGCRFRGTIELLGKVDEGTVVALGLFVGIDGAKMIESMLPT